MDNYDNGKHIGNDNWTLEELLLSFYTDKKVLSGNSSLVNTSALKYQEENSDFTFPVPLKSDFDTLMKTFLNHYSLNSAPNVVKQSSKSIKYKSLAKSEGKRLTKSEGKGCFADLKEVRCLQYPNGGTHSTDPMGRRRSAEKSSSQSCENLRTSVDKDRNCITITSDSSSDHLNMTDEVNDVTMRATSDVSLKEPTNNSKASSSEVKSNNPLSRNDPRSTTMYGNSFGGSINCEASTSGMPSIQKSISESNPTSKAQNSNTENTGTSKVYSVSSTIDISTSPDIYTSSPEIDVGSSVSQSREEYPRKQHIPIVNDPYMPNANNTYMPNANDPYMLNANLPYIPSFNDPYMLNANGPYLGNNNANMGNSNRLYMINTNGPYMPNANGSFSNSNNPYLQNFNGSYMTNANGPYRPNANGLYRSNTNNLFISNVNESFRSSACNSMPNTRGPFIPRPLNGCHCPNCFKSPMNSAYTNNSPLQFPAFITPCPLHPNHYARVLANHFVPAHINSQTSYTPVTHAPPLNQTCTPAASISSTTHDNHGGICKICNCSHASSVHMKSSGNDNSCPGKNQMSWNNRFTRPPIASHRGYGSFRGCDNQRPRPRDRHPLAFPRAPGGSRKGVPSLRNLPRSSLNNIMPKGKKVTEKYGRACNNCKTTRSKVWKYDEEGKPFCDICRFFHVHHRATPPPMTQADLMKIQGRNRRMSESYESEES